MPMTVKDVMNKYEEKFGGRKMAISSKEHFDFITDLANVSCGRWANKQPFPPNIDAATELSDEEAYAWLKRLMCLPE